MLVFETHEISIGFNGEYSICDSLQRYRETGAWRTAESFLAISLLTLRRPFSMADTFGRGTLPVLRTRFRLGRAVILAVDANTFNGSHPGIDAPDPIRLKLINELLAIILDHKGPAVLLAKPTEHPRWNPSANLQRRMLRTGLSHECRYGMPR